ncbi:MAG: hypothetical protein GEU90_18355 [Gemmatimonas sp.]|nr:hypothetical protein [Gemmatimonas sp.]
MPVECGGTMALMKGAILMVFTAVALSGVFGVDALEAQVDTLTVGESSGAVAGTDARIQPGDQIRLQVWREPDLSGDFTVDEQGEAILPRIGRLEAASMEAAALQDSLYVAYGRYLRNPSIEIAVLRRIGVHGEVRNPSLYMVDLTMTLREVIAMAGGITDAGNPERIAIIRGDEEIRLDTNGQEQFDTAELRSGDQIVVGRRSWLALNPLAALSASTALISFVVGVILPLVR